MLKVGDYVVVKEDLKVGYWYNDDVCVTEEMKQYFGKVARIKEVFFDDTYYLDIDDEAWFWSEDMLVKLEPRTEEKDLLIEELERKVKEIERMIKKLK